MQPTRPRRVRPEARQAAVVERFLATGQTAAELAREFDIPETTVQRWVDVAAHESLGPALTRPGTGPLLPADAQTVTEPADAQTVTEPAGWQPVLEAAARAVDGGGSIAEVARWFQVPEPTLRGWINERSAPWATAPPDGPDTEPAAVAAPAPVAVDPQAPEPVPAPVVPPAPEPVPAPVVPPAPEPVPAPVVAPAPEPAPAAAPVAFPIPQPAAPAPASAVPPTPPTPPAPPVEAAMAPSRPTPPRRTPTVYSSSGPVATTRRPSQPSGMGFRDFSQALRRRFLVVVIALFLGATAGWVTAPGETLHATTFEATHTLIYEARGGGYNIEQVALLATSGEVPSRVADRMTLDRAQVRAAVSAVAKGEVATIAITGQSAEAETAVALADITADELAAEVDGALQATYQADIGRLTSRVDTARGQLKAAKNLSAQAAARSELEAAEKALQQYQAKGPLKPQLRTLERAAASAVTLPGVQAPNSKPVRASLLGALGLLAGLAAALGLERLDNRVRTKASAEEAFGVPVVAEIARISKASQGGQLLARTQPSSPFVEAYRALRTYVALWAPEGDREDGHRVLVVTSPSAGEGKTTTTAHLAAMLAEIGRSVLVVSADLRRPRVHEYFDLPAGPGLVEALAARPGPPSFTGLDRPTSVRNVRLIPSGAPLENPAPLFQHAGDLLESVRGLADFVLIDAPPLLVANDAIEMARYADGVLLVARAGQTPIEAAERSAELLQRLEIPVVGTVLVASEAASSASRYYASHYYADPERKAWRRRRSDNGNVGRPEGETPQPLASASGEVPPTSTGPE